MALQGNERPGRPDRWPLVVGGAVAVVVLATVGAVGGKLVADAERTVSRTGAENRTTPTDSGYSPTTRGPAGPTGQRATDGRPSRPATNQLTVPNLVGKDFRNARDALRERKLGWRLVFGRSGDDGTVTSTDPSADAPVKQGTTVRVTVAGAAPVVAVPELIGKSCGEARKRVVEEGLDPRYPDGESGKVLSQQPGPDEQAHWNDVIVLHCGKPGEPSGDS
ncbi:hypothetical protein GCM10027605_74040 [Micromonospora zhanjiangensis]